MKSTHKRLFILIALGASLITPTFQYAGKGALCALGAGAALLGIGYYKFKKAPQAGIDCKPEEINTFGQDFTALENNTPVNRRFRQQDDNPAVLDYGNEAVRLYNADINNNNNRRPSEVTKRFLLQNLEREEQGMRTYWRLQNESAACIGLGIAALPFAGALWLIGL